MADRSTKSLERVADDFARNTTALTEKLNQHEASLRPAMTLDQIAKLEVAQREARKRLNTAIDVFGNHSEPVASSFFAEAGMNTSRMDLGERFDKTLADLSNLNAGLDILKKYVEFVPSAAEYKQITELLSRLSESGNAGLDKISSKIARYEKLHNAMNSGQREGDEMRSWRILIADIMEIEGILDTLTDTFRVDGDKSIEQFIEDSDVKNTDDPTARLVFLIYQTLKVYTIDFVDGLEIKSFSADEIRNDIQTSTQPLMIQIRNAIVNGGYDSYREVFKTYAENKTITSADALVDLIDRMSQSSLLNAAEQ
jgi:hypothetical protein